MPKNFCLFFSLKTGAMVAAFCSIMIGLCEVIGGIVELRYSKDEGDITLFIVCIVLGGLMIINGLILTVGIIQGKERFILLYLLIGLIYLFTITIYAGINMFKIKWLLIVFIASVLFWYLHFCVYGFYEEVFDYNKINSGAIEIAYSNKTYVNPTSFKQESFDSIDV